MLNYWKPGLAYLSAAGLHYVASRYHLTPDQVSAIVADLGALAAIAAGVQMHITTAKNGDGK